RSNYGADGAARRPCHSQQRLFVKALERFQKCRSCICDSAAKSFGGAALTPPDNITLKRVEARAPSVLTAQRAVPTTAKKRLFVKALERFQKCRGRIC